MNKHKPKRGTRNLYISAGIGTIISIVILYLTRGLNQITVNIKTGSLTGYETLPISVAKWEMGVLIFIVGAAIYNINQRSLQKKKNIEFSYVIIGLMTQGAVLAIGAY